MTVKMRKLLLKLDLYNTQYCSDAALVTGVHVFSRSCAVTEGQCSTCEVATRCSAGLRGFSGLAHVEFLGLGIQSNGPRVLGLRHAPVSAFLFPPSPFVSPTTCIANER